MNRTFYELSKLEQDFIDAAYIRMKKLSECSDLLCVDMSIIRQLNSDLRDVWKPITKIRDKWKMKNIGGDFWYFHNWYSTAKRCCSYCGITEDELEQLHDIGILNKRLTRGRTLEIDRKIANEEYSNIINLTYAC
ncbi:hypothetical protein D3C87_1733940 [compost metagenome]